MIFGNGKAESQSRKLRNGDCIDGPAMRRRMALRDPWTKVDLMKIHLLSCSYC